VDNNKKYYNCIFSGREAEETAEIPVEKQKAVFPIYAQVICWRRSAASGKMQLPLLSTDD